MEWDIVRHMYDEYYDENYYLAAGKWDYSATFEAYPQCGPIDN